MSIPWTPLDDEQMWQIKNGLLDEERTTKLLRWYITEEENTELFRREMTTLDLICGGITDENRDFSTTLQHNINARMNVDFFLRSIIGDDPQNRTIRPNPAG